MDFGQNTIIYDVCEIARKIFAADGKDEKSNRHIVRKCLRCDISSCFDMGNICCKDCSIKNCRYKCDFADKENCEHKYTE